MRNDRLIPGMILVIIGAIFLLDNFGYINFSWETFFSLWPIILIIAGVNLVFAHNRTGWATALKIIVLVIGMGILIWDGTTRHDSHWNFSWENNMNDSDSYTGSGNGDYNEPYNSAVQTAKLNISGGATSYTLKDTTNQLFDAKTRESGMGYTLKTSMDSATEVIDFSMNGTKNKRHGFFFFNHNGNKAVIRLNSKPVWDIDVSAGATNLKFDLTPYKVKKLELEGYAASLDVKMGEPLEATHIEIQSGASTVKIAVPRDAACDITTDTGLSSRNFNGFDKKDDSEYQTPGFDHAAKKMYIHIEGGMADFKVSRY
ncbi:DUF5668 domain-containing protein [uncultured Mucilaginibacter sp.]|uniref:LiaI-LiaF-like domain-containing protein n=1 Tax=uncultured Mucilaginibacter sp. TaxID=797541 RepID=UPI0025FB7CED|nr:DUF5668 domain-containing protein [uncultured Mucilaginibacter sp.]